MPLSTYDADVGTDTAPGFWSLYRELYLRPLSLHDRLVQQGVDARWSIGGYIRAGASPDARRVGLHFLGWCFLLPVLGFCAGLPLAVAGVVFSKGLFWSLLLVLLVSLGMMLVNALLAFTVVPVGVALFLAFHAHLGGSFGDRAQSGSWAAMGAIQGTLWGLALGPAFAARNGRLMSLHRGQIAAGVAALLPFLQYALAGKVERGAALGMTMLPALLLWTWRVPLYPLECLVQALAYAAQRLTGRCTLAWTPVMHHQLGFLSYPLLRAHLRHSAQGSQVPGMAEALERAVLACTYSPRCFELAWEYPELAFPELAPDFPPQDATSGKYACACCGHATVVSLAELTPCPVCGWCDAAADTSDPTSEADSLWAARRNYLKHRTAAPERQTAVRPPSVDEPRLRHFELEGETVVERGGRTEQQHAHARED